MGILDGKISIIKNNIYGEQIRGAIWQAFELLDGENGIGKLSNVPTRSEIATMIQNAISGMGGAGDGALSLKGVLPDETYLNYYATSSSGKEVTGIYVLLKDNVYRNVPNDPDFYLSDSILININSYDQDLDDGDLPFYSFVQIICSIGENFNGKIWIRTYVDGGWKEVGGSSGSSGLAIAGIIPNDTNLASFGTVGNEGIYRTITSYSYSGMPTGYDNSKVSILKNYVFTNSSGNVAYRIQELSYVDGTKSWIRGKTEATNFTVNEWKEVEGSGGSISPSDIQNAVNDYLDEHGVDPVDEQDIEDAVQSYLDDNLENLVDSAVNDAVSDLPDKTYSDNSELNTAVEKYKSITSGLTQDEITLINNAYNTYTGYTGNNTTAKPAVADGVLGLAAFQYAKNALGVASNPIRSAADVQASTNLFIGSDTGKVDVGRAMPVYNSLPTAEGVTAKAAVADGIVGLAAFKRTEWFPTPQMYGAYGDGEHDDKNAIQNAINANKGKTLYFPPGIYSVRTTITIGWADPADSVNSDKWYTNLILSPSAVIKAGDDWVGGDGGTGNANPIPLIAIGENDYHSFPKVKGRKKIFRGGVFDSNRKFVSTMIRVSQDVLDFDISDVSIRATNGTTGLAIGSSNWINNGSFVVSSMDAYVHHMIISKYYWSINELPVAKKESDAVNRASGIVIYASDNNFENIRINYFKRQVKFTHGSGQYFSDVHTLGLKQSPNAATNPIYSKQEPNENGSYSGNIYYDVDTSGFHFEDRAEVTLDQCYVDSDSYFAYVSSDAIGSTLSVSQCIHYQYSGVGRRMVGFHLDGAYYGDGHSTRTEANGSPFGKGKVNKLFVDGFKMSPNGDINDNLWKHSGIEINSYIGAKDTSNNYDASYFEAQMNSTNMSLDGIIPVDFRRFVHGDPLKGAVSGQKGSLCFKPTDLQQKDIGGTKSRHSYWYKLCDLPVGGGTKGAIAYRVTLLASGRIVTFPMSIRRSNANDVSLVIGLGGSSGMKPTTDDNREYEFGFSNSSNGAFYAYTMWIRIRNSAQSNGTGYSKRTIERVIFDSSYAITPSPVSTSASDRGILQQFTRDDRPDLSRDITVNDLPSFVTIKDANSSSTTGNVIYINCNGATMGVGSAASG